MRISMLTRCSALALSLSAGSVSANNLIDVYQLALENDPTIIASEYQRLATGASVDLAKSSRMPTVSTTFSLGQTGRHGTTSVHEDGITAAIQGQLPLLNRSNKLSVERAYAAERAANAVHTNAQQDLIWRTANAYFGVLRAQDNVNFGKAERESIFRQLDQAERRYDVGLAAITDVKEAQASYDLSVANVISAENDLRTAEEAMRVITNVYVKDLHRLKDEVALEPPQPDNVDSWVKTGIAQNPAMIEARENLNSAELGVKLAGASRYPSLDLIGSYQNSDTDASISGGSSSSSDTESHSLNLQLSVPLYTGGAVAASKSQAKFLSRASEKFLLITERDVERNVRVAFSTVEARISQVNALQRALESNQVGLEATEAGYDAGTRSAVDVLQSIRSTSNAAAQYAGARYDYILAMLFLRSTIGLLDEQDLNRFNEWLEPKE